MAAPSDIKLKDVSAAPASESLLANVVTQLNNTIEALRNIATKLDADGGVTQTDFFADDLDEAVATAPTQIDIS